MEIYITENRDVAAYILAKYSTLEDGTHGHILRIIDKLPKTREVLVECLAYWLNKSPEFIERAWDRY